MNNKPINDDNQYNNEIETKSTNLMMKLDQEAMSLLEHLLNSTLDIKLNYLEYKSKQQLNILKDNNYNLNKGIKFLEENNKDIIKFYKELYVYVTLVDLSLSTKSSYNINSSLNNNSNYNKVLSPISGKIRCYKNKIINTPINTSNNYFNSNIKNKNLLLNSSNVSKNMLKFSSPVSVNFNIDNNSIIKKNKINNVNKLKELSNLSKGKLICSSTNKNNTNKDINILNSSKFKINKLKKRIMPISSLVQNPENQSRNNAKIIKSYNFNNNVNNDESNKLIDNINIKNTSAINNNNITDNINFYKSVIKPDKISENIDKSVVHKKHYHCKYKSDAFYHLNSKNFSKKDIYKIYKEEEFKLNNARYLCQLNNDVDYNFSFMKRAPKEYIPYDQFSKEFHKNLSKIDSKINKADNIYTSKLKAIRDINTYGIMYPYSSRIGKCLLSSNTVEKSNSKTIETTRYIPSKCSSLPKNIYYSKIKDNCKNNFNSSNSKLNIPIKYDINDKEINISQPEADFFSDDYKEIKVYNNNSNKVDLNSNIKDTSTDQYKFTNIRNKSFIKNFINNILNAAESKISTKTKYNIDNNKSNIDINKFKLNSIINVFISDIINNNINKLKKSNNNNKLQDTKISLKKYSKSQIIKNDNSKSKIRNIDNKNMLRQNKFKSNKSCSNFLNSSSNINKLLAENTKEDYLSSKKNNKLDNNIKNNILRLLSKTFNFKIKEYSFDKNKDYDKLKFKSNSYLSKIYLNNYTEQNYINNFFKNTEYNQLYNNNHNELDYKDKVVNKKLSDKLLDKNSILHNNLVKNIYNENNFYNDISKDNSNINKKLSVLVNSNIFVEAILNNIENKILVNNKNNGYSNHFEEKKNYYVLNNNDNNNNNKMLDCKYNNKELSNRNNLLKDNVDCDILIKSKLFVSNLLHKRPHNNINMYTNKYYLNSNKDCDIKQKYKICNDFVCNILDPIFKKNKLNYIKIKAKDFVKVVFNKCINFSKKVDYFDINNKNNNVCVFSNNLVVNFVKDIIEKSFDKYSKNIINKITITFVDAILNNKIYSTKYNKKLAKCNKTVINTSFLKLISKEYVNTLLNNTVNFSFYNTSNYKTKVDYNLANNNSYNNYDLRCSKNTTYNNNNNNNICTLFINKILDKSLNIIYNKFVSYDILKKYSDNFVNLIINNHFKNANKTNKIAITNNLYDNTSIHNESILFVCEIFNTIINNINKNKDLIKNKSCLFVDNIINKNLKNSNICKIEKKKNNLNKNEKLDKSRFVYENIDNSTIFLKKLCCSFVDKTLTCTNNKVFINNNAKTISCLTINFVNILFSKVIDSNRKNKESCTVEINKTISCLDLLCKNFVKDIINNNIKKINTYTNNYNSFVSNLLSKVEFKINSNNKLLISKGFINNILHNTFKSLNYIKINKISKEFVSNIIWLNLNKKNIFIKSNNTHSINNYFKIQENKNRNIKYVINNKSNEFRRSSFKKQFLEDNCHINNKILLLNNNTHYRKAANSFVSNLFNNILSNDKFIKITENNKSENKLKEFNKLNSTNINNNIKCKNNNNTSSNIQQTNINNYNLNADLDKNLVSNKKNKQNVNTYKQKVDSSIINDRKSSKIKIKYHDVLFECNLDNKSKVKLNEFRSTHKEEYNKNCLIKNFISCILIKAYTSINSK